MTTLKFMLDFHSFVFYQLVYNLCDTDGIFLVSLSHTCIMLYIVKMVKIIFAEGKIIQYSGGRVENG